MMSGGDVHVDSRIGMHADRRCDMNPRCGGNVNTDMRNGDTNSAVPVVSDAMVAFDVTLDVVFVVPPLAGLGR
jgi:hypothetical protein